MLVRENKVQLLDIVVSSGGPSARSTEVVENTTDRRCRKQLVNDIESDWIDNRSALCVAVKVDAVAGDGRTVTTRHSVVKNLNWSTEETKYRGISQQFRKVTSAHFQSWHAHINSLGLIETIATVVEKEERFILK